METSTITWRPVETPGTNWIGDECVTEWGSEHGQLAFAHTILDSYFRYHQLPGAWARIDATEAGR